MTRTSGRYLGRKTIRAWSPTTHWASICKQYDGFTSDPTFTPLYGFRSRRIAPNRCQPLRAMLFNYNDLTLITQRSLVQSCSVLTVNERLEKCGRMRGIEHGSHAPETTMNRTRICVHPTGSDGFSSHGGTHRSRRERTEHRSA